MSGNILITGGAGFIGTNVADRYLSSGQPVAILDSFRRTGSRDNAQWLKERHGTAVTIVEGDVRDRSGVLARVVEAASVVYHLAGQVAVTSSIVDPREDFEINAGGTLNLLEAVRLSSSPPIVVYSSTNKVYGPMPDVAVIERETRFEYADNREGISENRAIDFYSPYGCSKGAGDQYMLDYARVFGLRTVVMRQSCVYGPHQFGIEDQGWVAWFAIQAMNAAPVTIYGNGKQVRDVLYIDDLIDAYEMAVAKIDVTAGRAYNIGGGPGNTLSPLELISRLESHFGRPLVHTFAEQRAGDQLVFVSDVCRAKEDFGWVPRTAVTPGLDRLLGFLETSVTVRSGGRDADKARAAGPDTHSAKSDAAKIRRLSVVIPARNEEATLSLVLEDLQAVIQRLDAYDAEVIVVDDSSTDS